MMLIEQTTVPAEALPVSLFKDHLRLGSGFADDSAQDALLEALLRAAMAAVEGRTGKVLLGRTFTWTLTAWRDGDRQALPVAPVQALNEVRVVDNTGGATIVDAAVYRLEKDTHRPRVATNGAALPVIPLGGSVEVVFDAGFGAAWADVPEDLAQAVFLLAGHYYEHRSEAAFGESGMPFGVLALLERWRTVRILGGGAI
ncbi:head-tail connector protein [Actibacterium lipolyticum]|uniref:Phage gp6-like head-tail connector protein n=1 Tax=Actibacterium lipolyticum TaxID=1524263 RepID=A0A238KHJ4_9RHOB|nr:head-tail connector protein [Actibacterium lipolyticum]SMX42064.1 Phage gp6-like head-tail connector protein [Actibacterium lipolyticum]